MLTLLLQILADYGWWALLCIGLLFAAFKISMIFVENKIKLNMFSRTKEPDLKYHQFFSDMQYKIIVEIPALDFLDHKPVRQQLFKDLLKIYYKCLYEKGKSMCALDMKHWSAERWTQEVSNSTRQVITDFNAEAREHGIPEIVLTKFTKWNASTIDLLYEYINLLGTSTTYSSNIMRTNTLLLIMNLLSVTTLADAERTMSELNGEITGEKYKGRKIEDCG